MIMAKRSVFILALIVALSCAGCAPIIKQDKEIRQHTAPVRPEAPKLATDPGLLPSESNRKEVKLPLRPEANPSHEQGIVPTRLYIPSLDLHADIEPVGVLDNGQMGVPADTESVGYLAGGALPGAAGNAVMAGHVDHYKGPAVFYGLRYLKKGDQVVVKNVAGRAIAFVVDEVKSYKPSEAPIRQIFGPSAESRLNLITCSGKYSRKKREHQERLVVYAKRIVS
ncbi:class F sortase [Cohnella boryungensis]|uniref:Class F sortase n=2 Tax=Cohnella boryungensis TaxID=768479 RepID=A0ABV8S6C2_9BACL